MGSELRVAAFTGGRHVASARFRVRQLIPTLRTLGIRMNENVAPFGAYPPSRRALRPLWAAATLASRVPAVAASYRYDLTFLQREMVSTFRTLEPLTHGPRLLDLDDAVWLHRESQYRRLVAGMDGVVCGNPFIEQWVQQWQSNCVVIPTAVDTDRWCPLPAVASAGPRYIGWTGQSSGMRYVEAIEEALATVLGMYPDVVLRIVSDRPPELRSISAHRVEYVPWSPEVEVTTVQQLSVGIMPLQDSPWERGKCAYKMLLYMSCGIPVVVSPVGMNSDVLARGEVGLAAGSAEEWVSAIACMLDDPHAARQMGAAGRSVVLEHFACTPLAARLAAYFRQFAS